MNSAKLEKSLVENIQDAKYYREHIKRINNVEFSGMSILNPHPIVSRRAIHERKISQKILRENALMITKLKNVEEGRTVSTFFSVVVSYTNTERHISVYIALSHSKYLLSTQRLSSD